MTHIAFIVLDDLSTTNGTTVRVRSVARLLAEEHDITIVNCSKKTPSEIQGIRILNVEGVGWNRLKSVTIPIFIKLFSLVMWNLKVGLILLRNKFDIIYCVDEFYSFFTVLLISKLRKSGIIFEAHGICSEEGKEAGSGPLRYKFDKKLEQLVVKYSDYIVALSKNIYDFYVQYNTKIEIIPVFLDMSNIKLVSSKNQMTSPVIGLIGPFAGVSRQMYYLEFLYKNIDYFDKRIHFLVIGYCEKRIQHMNIQYTDYLPSFDEYLQRIATLSAVIVPEGIATSGPLNKIIEPMSHAVPVFTTPKAMVGLYWIESGKDILVFEEEELVDNINRLVFDSELMATIGKNAQKVVIEYYSKEANKEKLSSILQHFIGP